MLVVAGVLAGLGCAAPVWAGHIGAAECRPDDPLGIVGTLPQSADAVVVIEGGARQRASAAGIALSAFLGESGLFQETSAAWSSLAASLKLSPQEAFDLTLGQRAIVVISGLFDSEGGPGAARWALLSHVCPRTEVLIRESLSPAPRSIEGGRAILALENGAYELATSACRSAQGNDGSMILLAPAKDSELFDSLLPVLTGKVQGPTLSQCESWEQAVRLGGGDVLFYLRRPTSGTTKEQFLVCAARCAPTGWTASFTASAGLLWDGIGADLPEVYVPAGLRHLAKEATALYCGPLAPLAKGGRRSPLSLGLPMPQRLPSELTDCLGPTILAALHDAPVHGSDSGGAGRRGGISMSLAVQTCDVATTAALGDRLLARLVAKRSMAEGPVIELVGTRAPAPARPPAETIDFRRLCPSDARVVELTDSEQGAPDQCGRAYLSWSYVDAPDRAPSGRRRGWWLINLVQGSSDDGAGERPARDGLDLLNHTASTPAVPEQGLLSRACIRPDRIAATLGYGAPSPCAGFVRSLRWIESIQWDVARAQGGLVAGSITVRMRPDPAP